MNDESIYVQASDVIKVRATRRCFQKNAMRFGKNSALVPIAAAELDFKKEEDEVIKLKRAIHHRLVERMNLQKMSPEILNDPSQAANMRKAAEKVVTELLAETSGAFLSSHEERSRLVREIVNEALGLGPSGRFAGRRDHHGHHGQQ